MEDPYWYWPQCDVENCINISASGGHSWKDTGYWNICSEHMNDYRKGKEQPKMKQTATDRENSRDEDGYLPSVSNNLKKSKKK